MTYDEAIHGAIDHYLSRCGALLAILGTRPDAAALLSTRLAPDAFTTGDHLAIAIRFAGRAVGPPNGLDVPDIPEGADLAVLETYRGRIAGLIAGRRVDPMGPPVAHRAGEAELAQPPAEYVARFALPNLLFHMAMAYAALRVAGLPVGKADFDGLHEYPPPMSPDVARS